MFAALPQPAVVAHRGSSAHAPENTLAAFELARQHGADALELDIRCTADSELVVLHDPQLDRTTPAKGPIRNFTFPEVSALDAGSWFHAQYSQERIPHLAQVLDSIGTKLPLNIELKSPSLFPRDLINRTAELLNSRVLDQPALISSFNPFLLSRIHTLLPEFDLGLILPPGLLPWWTRTGALNLLPLKSVHAPWPDLTEERIQTLQSRGWKVLAYTVNDPHQLKRLCSAGIDGVITDDPILARKIIDDQSAVE